jgi:hypothetical protein
VRVVCLLQLLDGNLSPAQVPRNPFLDNFRVADPPDGIASSFLERRSGTSPRSD